MTNELTYSLCHKNFTPVPYCPLGIISEMESDGENCIDVCTYSIILGVSRDK